MQGCLEARATSSRLLLSTLLASTPLALPCAVLPRLGSAGSSDRDRDNAPEAQESVSRRRIHLRQTACSDVMLFVRPGRGWTTRIHKGSLVGIFTCLFSNLLLLEQRTYDDRCGCDCSSWRYRNCHICPASCAFNRTLRLLSPDQAPASRTTPVF